MGKQIEQILLERGHSISLRVTADNADFSSEELVGTDVAIEFTQPEAAPKNIRKCFAHKVPVVVGTTGWYDHYDTVSSEANKFDGALLAATNFSVGVNVFFEINRRLAKLLNHHANYDAKIEEIHHTEKLDSPSGTAISIAEGILDETDRKTNWVNNLSDNPTDLEIISKREPNVPGTHTVNFASEIDSIEIKHTAHNRRGFALGAVLAAEFLAGKQGIYKMADVLNLNNSGKS